RPRPQGEAGGGLRHARLPWQRARRPAPQSRRDGRPAAPDGSHPSFRPVQSRPPDLCRAEARRYRTPVRAALSASPSSGSRMHSQIYWVGLAAPGRLATMACPRAGDWLADEVAGWKAAGLDTVISLLEREEEDDLALRQESTLCRGLGLDFVSFPIVDYGLPASAPHRPPPSPPP